MNVMTHLFGTDQCPALVFGSNRRQQIQHINDIVLSQHQYFKLSTFQVHVLKQLDLCDGSHDKATRFITSAAFRSAIIPNILIYSTLALIYLTSYGYTQNSDSDALSWMLTYTSRQVNLSDPWHTIRMFLHFGTYV